MKTKLISATIISLFLQRIFIIYVPFLNYFDEFLTILFGVYLLYMIVNKQIRLCKIDKVLIYLFIFSLLLGLIGNLRSGILNNLFAISIDIISMYRVFIAYYFFKYLTLNKENLNIVIEHLVLFTRYFIYSMIIGYILSLIFDIGFMSKARYGIPSFNFLFNNPGNLSKAFYFLIIFITINLKTKSKKSIFDLIITLLLWISTMRSRAFAFVFIYTIGYLYVLVFNKKFNLKLILLSGLSGFIIAFNQVVFYFTTTTQARNRLLVYGIETMKTYFPTGAGFGTYGSNISGVYYSKLYYEYGFNEIRGLGLDSTIYINDNYWPMIIGQFGFFGLFIFVISLFVITIDVIKKSFLNSNYVYYGVFISTLFLLISSLASKSYAEFSSVCIFSIYGLISNINLYIEESE